MRSVVVWRKLKLRGARWEVVSAKRRQVQVSFFSPRERRQCHPLPCSMAILLIICLHVGTSRGRANLQRITAKRHDTPTGPAAEGGKLTSLQARANRRSRVTGVAAPLVVDLPSSSLPSCGKCFGPLAASSKTSSPHSSSPLSREVGNAGEWRSKASACSLLLFSFTVESCELWLRVVVHSGSP